jgi:hypothetical protein
LLLVIRKTMEWIASNSQNIFFLVLVYGKSNNRKGGA